MEEQEMISMQDTRRKLTSFLLATTIIFCCSTVYYAYRTNRTTRAVQDNYQQSLNQLMESLANINTTLKKVGYSADHALLTTLAADIWTQSEAAKVAMSCLPLSDHSLEQCETFIAQAGDYAYYLLRATAYEAVDEQAWNTLASLSETASSLYTKLDAMKEQADIGILTFDSEKNQPGDSISGSFSEIESQFPEYAQLIYDGPYSEHIQNKTPLYLKGKDTVTEAEGRAAAAAALGIAESEVSDEYTADGTIPAFGYTAGTTSIAITKAGGLLLSLLNNRHPESATLTEQQAIAVAQEFLQKLGYKNMEPTYYLTYESVVTVNFAYTENDTVYYPDLMQVGIALDDGSVTRFDATGYFMNHHDRNLGSPTISMDTAKSVIPKQAAVQSQTLAVIPTDGQMEKLCYAFSCEHEDGQKLLYYVNANTGRTENLFILIDTRHGTLTM